MFKSKRSAEELSTADLFLSALFLTRQHPIQDIRLEQERIQKKILFVFSKTNKTEVLKEQYKHGIAEANVLELKHNYLHLLDLLHEAKRKFHLN